MQQLMWCLDTLKEEDKIFKKIIKQTKLQLVGLLNQIKGEGG